MEKIEQVLRAEDAARDTIAAAHAQADELLTQTAEKVSHMKAAAVEESANVAAAVREEIVAAARAAAAAAAEQAARDLEVTLTEARSRMDTAVAEALRVVRG